MLLEREPHVLTHGPACVHGDIGERCDREIWEDLHHLENQAAYYVDSTLTPVAEQLSMLGNLVLCLFYLA